MDKDILREVNKCLEINNANVSNLAKMVAQMNEHLTQLTNVLVDMKVRLELLEEEKKVMKANN